MGMCRCVGSAFTGNPCRAVWARGSGRGGGSPCWFLDCWFLDEGTEVASSGLSEPGQPKLHARCMSMTSCTKEKISTLYAFTRFFLHLRFLFLTRGRSRGKIQRNADPASLGSIEGPLPLLPSCILPSCAPPPWIRGLKGDGQALPGRRGYIRGAPSALALNHWSSPVISTLCSNEMEHVQLVLTTVSTATED